MPPLSFERKRHAIVYINSNCHPRSQRRDAMRGLIAELKHTNSSLQVHSYGRCDNNMDAQSMKEFDALVAESGHKNGFARYDANIKLFSKYKFCVVSVCCIMQ
jgi:hypothetical protein